MDAQPAEEAVGEVRLVPALAKTLLTYLHAARENERGGVLLGRFEDSGVTVSGAVFPPQLTRARNHCAFDVQDIDIVREAMSAMVVIVGWVHSHPKWGIFMSETDKRTMRSWVSLDERAVAIVIDPFATHWPERIGCWGKNGEVCLDMAARPDREGFTIEQASHLAQAIGGLTTSGRWDVLVPGNITTVFSAWTDS
jgi:proteasome lid subunit RPN8/RPN11